MGWGSEVCSADQIAPRVAIIIMKVMISTIFGCIGLARCYCPVIARPLPGGRMACGHGRARDGARGMGRVGWCAWDGARGMVRVGWDA